MTPASPDCHSPLPLSPSCQASRWPIYTLPPAGSWAWQTWPPRRCSRSTSRASHASWRTRRCLAQPLAASRGSGVFAALHLPLLWPRLGRWSTRSSIWRQHRRQRQPTSVSATGRYSFDVRCLCLCVEDSTLAVVVFCLVFGGKPKNATRNCLKFHCRGSSSCLTSARLPTAPLALTAHCTTDTPPAPFQPKHSPCWRRLASRTPLGGIRLPAAYPRGPAAQKPGHALQQSLIWSVPAACWTVQANACAF